jgi:hypothetical protein
VIQAAIAAIAERFAQEPRRFRIPSVIRDVLGVVVQSLPLVYQETQRNTCRDDD